MKWHFTQTNPSEELAQLHFFCDEEAPAFGTNRLAFATQPGGFRTAHRG